MSCEKLQGARPFVERESHSGGVCCDGSEGKKSP